MLGTTVVIHITTLIHIGTTMDILGMDTITLITIILRIATSTDMAFAIFIIPSIMAIGPLMAIGGLTVGIMLHLKGPTARQRSVHSQAGMQAFLALGL